MLEYLFTHTPLLFFVQNLWRDEAFSYVLAIRSIPEILKLTAGDFNPPLYYILLHYWMLLFGSSEIAMRSLSFIFFLGTIYIVYDICLYVFHIPHKRTSVYFLIFLLNPFLLTFAFEARMYMMVTFFVTLSYFSLWTGRKKLYIASIALALYTHYLSIFIFGIQALSVLFAFWLKHRHKNIFQTLLLELRYFFVHFTSYLLNHKSKKTLNTNYQLLDTIIIPGLLFLPWAVFMLLSHNFSDGAFWIPQPYASDFWHLPFILYTGYERIFGVYYHDREGYTAFHSDMNALLWAIMLIPLGIYLFSKRHNVRSIATDIAAPVSVVRDTVLWAFFPPVLIFLLSFVSQPLFLPRYYIFAAVGFLLLLVVCFEKILFYHKKATIFTIFIAAILGIFLATFTKTFNTLNLKYHSKRNVKSLYNEIKSLKTPSDLIYLDSELDYHLAQYYFGMNQKIYIYNKTYTDIPQFVGKVLIPPDALTQVLPSYPIRAFVVYYHWYNIRSIL